VLNLYAKVNDDAKVHEEEINHLMGVKEETEQMFE